jgi:ABC-type glycerol-3-phosphate transport system permease component
MIIFTLRQLYPPQKGVPKQFNTRQRKIHNNKRIAKFSNSLTVAVFLKIIINYEFAYCSVWFKFLKAEDLSFYYIFLTFSLTRTPVFLVLG